jgi:hypothetical protein
MDLSLRQKYPALILRDAEMVSSGIVMKENERKGDLGPL